MRKQYAFVIVTMLALLTAEARAEQLLFLTGGRVFKGEVLSSTPNSVTARVKIEGSGEQTHTVSSDECDPHFFYSVRNKAIGNDAAARIELAKYCVDFEMYSRAKAQMDRARQIDEKVVEKFMKEEFPKIKEGLAAKLLSAGQRSLRRGSTKNAKKYASLILTKFEDTEAIPGAEKLLDAANKKEEEANSKKRAQRRKSEESEAAVKVRMETEKKENVLAPVEKLLDEGQRANTRGLKAKNMSDTRNGFGTAATKYERAMKRCDDFMKQDIKDPTVTTALNEMNAAAKEGAIQAYLNLARSLSARGSYNEAVKQCNMALAIDPNHAEAKAARAEISTTTGDWGGRGRRGRRR